MDLVKGGSERACATRVALIEAKQKNSFAHASPVYKTEREARLPVKKTCVDD